MSNATGISRDLYNMTKIKRIQLFVSTDCESCEQILDYVQGWVQRHPTVQLDILPVLEHPIDVVRHQIFYTPALVIDGQAIGEQNLSIARMTEILNAETEVSFSSSRFAAE